MPRGKKKTPGYIRIRNGNGCYLPSDQQLALKEGIPEAPDFLSEESKKCWDRMVLMLKDIGNLALVSHDKLTRYCEAWSDFVLVAKEKRLLEKVGRPFWKITSRSEKARNDLWSDMISKAESCMQDFEKQYGLTPLSASKVRKGGINPTASSSPEAQLNEFLDAKPIIQNDSDTEEG